MPHSHAELLEFFGPCPSPPSTTVAAVARSHRGYFRSATIRLGTSVVPLARHEVFDLCSIHVGLHRLQEGSRFPVYQAATIQVLLDCVTAQGLKSLLADRIASKNAFWTVEEQFAVTI